MAYRKPIQLPFTYREKTILHALVARTFFNMGMEPALRLKNLYRGLPPPVVDLLVVDPRTNKVQPPDHIGELWM